MIEQGRGVKNVYHDPFRGSSWYCLITGRTAEEWAGEYTCGWAVAAPLFVGICALCAAKDAKVVRMALTVAHAGGAMST